MAPNPADISMDLNLMAKEILARLVVNNELVQDMLCDEFAVCASLLNIVAKL